MSGLLTHVLRRAQAGPEMGHYVQAINVRGELSAMTPDLRQALRLTRDEAEQFQRETGGWFVAVRMLELMKPTVWGRLPGGMLQ